MTDKIEPDERADKIKPYERPISNKLKKVRPIVLKRFLIFHLKNEVYGVTSERSKHDYVLALEIFNDITQLKEQHPDQY